MLKYGAAGFSIGTKGYIGTGNGSAAYSDDFWEWDQQTNVWTQKAKVPVGLRDGAVGFSIGNKGYISTGRTMTTYMNDLWEWDQTANTWIQKTNLSGSVRQYATAFSIGSTKGYIGTGQTGSSSVTNDFWEWNQSSNTWSQKANFGGTARSGAVGFSIGTMGYIGMGASGNFPNFIYYNDFWEWDQANNSWTQKANLPAIGRAGAVGFSTGTNGYIGTGFNYTPPTYCNDFWEWDQLTNTWSQKTNFGGATRNGAVGFAIGGKGYIGTGNSGSGNYQKDFWEFDPNGNDLDEIGFKNSISLFPNPCATKLKFNINNFLIEKISMEILDILGNSIQRVDIHKTEETLDVSDLPSGVYYLKITSEGKSAVKKFVKM